MQNWNLGLPLQQQLPFPTPPLASAILLPISESDRSRSLTEKASHSLCPL